MTIRTCPAALAIIAAFSLPAFATAIPITTSALPTMTFAPSSDTFSLTAGSVSATAPGTIAFQTGTFTRGSTTTASQVIAFSFSETMTINGVTRTFNILGQDNVTATADTLTILAGTPINFGGYTFDLNGATFSATSAGQTLPVTLSGVVSVTAVPEPAPFALLGTGLLGVFLARPGSSLRLRSPLTPKI